MLVRDQAFFYNLACAFQVETIYTPHPLFFNQSGAKNNAYLNSFFFFSPQRVEVEEGEIIFFSDDDT